MPILKNGYNLMITSITSYRKFIGVLITPQPNMLMKICLKSIGANYSEALSAESNQDFVHKLAISQKEANETSFWLELLYSTEYLTDKQYESLDADCTELRKIITSIILTAKQKKEKP